MMFRLATSVALLALIATAPRAGASLILNGSFEQYALTPSEWSDPNLLDLDVRTPNLPGWTVSASPDGTVDLISAAYWPASDGSYSLDLVGTKSGSVSQSFPTTPGLTYRVTFDRSGNPYYLISPPIKTLSASIAGVITYNYSWDRDAEGNSSTDMKWRTESFDFTAVSTTSTLTFTSTAPGDYLYTGPALDNVSVTLLPEPGTLSVPCALTCLLARRCRRATR